MRNHCRELIAEIETLFREGITLEAREADFIDSTFAGQPLAAIVAEPSSPERDTLCELLFFPDETLQRRIEPLLENHRFSADDAERVAEELGRRRPEATFYFRGARAPLTMNLPAEVAASFVSRLKITARIDPQLRAVIDRRVPADLQNVVKVRLRNARPIPETDKRDFLSAFIEKQVANAFFLADLDFLLAVLDEFDDRCDMYRALNEKKRTCAVNLIKLQRWEERRQNENFETLMARGERIPYLDKAAARETIERIDRICLGVFGRTEPLRDLSQTEDRIQCSSVEDLQELVRKLV